MTVTPATSSTSVLVAGGRLGAHCRPLQAYNQYCPIAKGAEVFADRWTPLIVRELLGGTESFNQLHRGLPGLSRSLLAQRLRALEHAGVLTHAPNTRGKAARYELTTAGRDLQGVVDSLGNWGARWALRDPNPRELDPYLVLLWMSRHVDSKAVPAERTTIQFEFPAAKTRWLWLMLEPDEASVCLKYPGFDIDLRVTAEITALYDVYLGRTRFLDARRAGTLRLEGPAAHVRSFPRWFTWSRFAPTVRAAIGEQHAPTTQPAARG